MTGLFAIGERAKVLGQGLPPQPAKRRGKLPQYVVESILARYSPQ